MTIEEFLNEIGQVEIHNVSLDAMLFDTDIPILPHNFMKENERIYYFNREDLHHHVVNIAKILPLEIYTLSYLVAGIYLKQEPRYYHPRHFFRLGNGVAHHVKLPVPLDYRTVSHWYPKYQVSELNNRAIIQKICTNSCVTSFLANRFELNNENKIIATEPMIYICGDGFYAYFRPELLLETDFFVEYGQPELKVNLLNRNRFQLEMSASTASGYLRDRDTEINAIFDLNLFSFEKFETSQSYSSRR